MTDVPDNLVLEHLRHIRHIRSKVDQIDERMGRVEVRLMTVERHVGALVSSHADQNADIDSLRDRVARIERRLDLVD